MHVVFSVHAQRHARGGRGSALDLVEVEAHESFVLFGELVAESRLVLRAQRRLLVAQHALAYHADLLECEERAIVDLLLRRVRGAVRWRSVALRAARRRARRHAGRHAELPAALEALYLVADLLGHALWGQLSRCTDGFSKRRGFIFRHSNSRTCAWTCGKRSTSSSFCRQLSLPIQISFQCSTRHFLFTPNERPLHNTTGLEFQPISQSD